MMNEETDQNECMEQITTREIQSAIDRLKKRKGERQQWGTSLTAQQLQ